MSRFSQLKYKIIGEEMKKLESESCSCQLSNDKPIIFRLDGHKFSSFTRGFRKPYDNIIHEAMIETAKDIMNEYSFITTSYIMSDEITLYVPRTLTKTNELIDLPFGGRLMKTCTLLSGVASSRFNYHLRNIVQNLGEQEIQSIEKQTWEKIKQKSQSGTAFFDARGHNIDTDIDAFYNILWRSEYDCQRNSKTNLGHSFYSAKQLHRLKSDEIIEKLKREKNIDWNTYPSSYKWGTTIKKKRVFKTSLNPITGVSVQVVRSEYLAIAFRFERKEYWSSLLNAKYWDEIPKDIFDIILPNHTQIEIPENKNTLKRKRDVNI